MVAQLLEVPVPSWKLFEKSSHSLSYKITQTININFPIFQATSLSKMTLSPWVALAFWDRPHSAYGTSISVNLLSASHDPFLNYFLREVKNPHWQPVPGTHPRPETWPLSHAPFSCNNPRYLETWTSHIYFILLHHSLCQASPFFHFPPSLVLKWKLPHYEGDKLVLGRRSKKKGKDCFNKQVTNVQNSQLRIYFLISSTILQSYPEVIILPILQTKKLRLGNYYRLMSSDLQPHSFHSSKLPLFASILQNSDVSALSTLQAQHRGMGVGLLQLFKEHRPGCHPAVRVWADTGHAPFWGHNSQTDLDSGKYFPETSYVFSKWTAILLSTLHDTL